MRANLFIVHHHDALLRAVAGLLISERYLVRTEETIEALLADLRTAGRPALLLVDEDAAGAHWRERLEDVPEDVPRVVLTWYPWQAAPPRVTLVAKPFGARELLETVSELLATDGAGAGPPR